MPEESYKFDVFVSYADEDAPWVEGYLLDAFDEGGINYHDEAAFRLGVPRLVEFERAIKESKRTLLILSPAYLAENFTQFIETLAQSYGDDTGIWPVIPFVLKKLELPQRIKRLNILEAIRPEAWDKAIARLFQELQLPVPEAAPLPDCPYPGMIPFTEKDSNRFFGRDPEIEMAMRRLKSASHVTVIGPSGSGKSSMVFAGLLPKLRRSRSFGKGEWDVRTMRPGHTPSRTLHDTLDFHPHSYDYTKIKKRILLIVDQFEEVFTNADAFEAEEFLTMLRHITQQPNIYMIITCRADFYADLMSSPIWDIIKTNRLELPPMSAEGLREAIVKPAQEVGVYVEGPLVERLVADAGSEPGVLPLVQETLVLIWDKVTRRLLPLESYEMLSLERGGEQATGLQVALALRADATLNELDEDKQAITRRVLLRLVQFGEGRADTRRQQVVGKLKSANDDTLVFRDTIQHLTENRLITLSSREIKDSDKNMRLADISHEALIRSWPTLRNWIEARRESEIIRRRLESKATEWARLGSEQAGLLDEVEYNEASRWIDSIDAQEAGFSETLADLITLSGSAIQYAKDEQERNRQREIQQAQALAEEQKKVAQEQRKRAEEQAASAEQLRKRALVLSALVVVAVLLSALAAWTGNQAARNADQAQANAQEARSNLQVALTQESLAIEKEILAEENENLAVAARETAVANQQEAILQRNEAERQRTEAERQAILARSRELSAHSQNALLENRPQLSLLLAIEGIIITNDIDETRTPPAEQALRAALGQIGGEPLDDGHRDRVEIGLISHDNRHIATGSYDGTARIWDLESEYPYEDPRVFDNQNGAILGMDISPDDRWLATGTSTGSAFLWDLTQESVQPITLTGHTGVVFRLGFSPDKRWLVTTSRDGTARMWDIKAENPAENSLVLDEHTATVWRLAFSPDQRWLATGSSDTTARLWDLTAEDPSAESIPLRGHSSWVTAMTFTPDSRWLLTGGNDGDARLWDMTNPEAESIRLGGHLDTIWTVAVSPDGRWAATGSRDSAIRLWDLTAADPSASPVVLRGHTNTVWQLAFSPDNRFLISGSFDNTTRLWDLNNDDPAGTAIVLRGHDADVQVVALSPDGTTLMTASDDGDARVWDLGDLDLSASPIVLRTRGDSLTELAMSPNGNWIAAGGESGSAYIWDLNDPFVSPRSLDIHTATVNTLVASTDNRFLISGGDDGRAVVWDLTPLARPPVVLNLDNPVKAVALSPDQQVLVVGDEAGHILNWSFDNLYNTPQPTPTEIYKLETSVTALTFSPNGKWFAVGASFSETITGTEKVVLWDTSDFEQPARSFRNVDREIRTLAFSPNSQWLAAGGEHATPYHVFLWPLGGNAVADTTYLLDGHESEVNQIGFTDDSRIMFTASRDRTTQVWDLEKAVSQAETSPEYPIYLLLRAENAATRLSEHDDSVLSAAFNHQTERWFITGSQDSNALIWDRQDWGAVPVSLRGHTGAVEQVLVSPDDQWIVTASRDGTVRLWALDVQELFGTACDLVGRNLTEAEWATYLYGSPYMETCVIADE